MPVLRLIGFLLATFGSLPLAHTLTLIVHPAKDSGRPTIQTPRTQLWLTTIVLWMLMQGAVAEGLLAAHAFALLPELLLQGSLALLGGFLLWTLPPRPDLRRTAKPERRRWLPFAALGLLLLGLLWWQPLSDFDSLAYHLPTVEGWLRTAHHAAPRGFESDQIGAYPYVWEAICAQGQLALRSDSLLLLPNLIAWALLGLAVYRLGKDLGASTASTPIAALLLLCQPLVIEQVSTLHVDLPFAALFVSGVSLVLRWSRSRHAADAVLAAVCAALLCAIKMSGFPYAAMLVALAVLLRLTVRPPKSQNPLSAAMGAALVLTSLTALFVAGFFYLLNLQRLGNPLGYIPVRIGSLSLFAGRAGFLEQVQKTTLAQLFRFRDPSHLLVLGKVSAYYLGLPFLALSILLLVGLWQRRVRAWIVLLLIACLAMYFRTPYSADNGSHNWQITTWIGQALRYGLPALGILAAGAATGFDSLLRFHFLRKFLGVSPVLLALFRVATSEHLLSQGIKLDSGAAVKLLLGGELASLLVSGLLTGVLIHCQRRIQSRR